MGVYIPTDIYTHNKPPKQGLTNMVKKITKPIEEVIEEVKTEPITEPIVEEEEAASAAVVESAEKAAFRLFIENYKVSNPVKYEMKKEVLEKQLNEIK